MKRTPAEFYQHKRDKARDDAREIDPLCVLAKKKPDNKKPEKTNGKIFK